VADNFARDDARIGLRPGTTLMVRLSPHTEGVWYENTSGWIGGWLVVEQYDPETETWVRRGHDGSRALRRGPSIGRAPDIKVPVSFAHNGHHRLRVKIWTFAFPCDLDGRNFQYRHAGHDWDLVHIGVHVGEPPPEGEDVPPDPDGETVPSIFRTDA
jgi:hypothetical protein